jgi:hypothetical protein
MSTELPRSSNDEIIQTGSLQGAVTQAVSISGTTAKSTALGKATRLIRIVSTEPCFIRMGLTGDAALVTDMPLLQNIPEYFGVTPEQFIHAIMASGSGTLTITEV